MRVALLVCTAMYLKKNVSQNNIFFLFLWSLVQFKTIYFTCIVCKSVLKPID